jgi:hypothetical protein
MQPLEDNSKARVVLVTAVAFLVVSLQLPSAAATTQARNNNGASGTESSANAQSTAPVPIGGGWIRFVFGAAGKRRWAIHVLNPDPGGAVGYRHRLPGRPL